MLQISYDFKIFWKYLLDKHLHPKNYIKSSAFYEYIIVFMLLYSVFFTTLSLQRKAILTICFILAYSFIKFYGLYKSGQHKAWNREKYNIPTKSDIRKIKQNELKEKEGDENKPPVG